jgi:hypothetical protein
MQMLCKTWAGSTLKSAFGQLSKEIQIIWIIYITELYAVKQILIGLLINSILLFGGLTKISSYCILQ